jgi:hypothetical protein
MPKNKTRKIKIHTGGKTFAADEPVQLFYKTKALKCEACEENEYKETIGTFGKSKVRTALTDVFFGTLAGDVFATTSVKIYTCTTCSLCKVIRNKAPFHIKAVPA